MAFTIAEFARMKRRVDELERKLDEIERRLPAAEESHSLEDSSDAGSGGASKRGRTRMERPWGTCPRLDLVAKVFVAVAGLPAQDEIIPSVCALE